jgi:hypothetical protein
MNNTVFRAWIFCVLIVAALSQSLFGQKVVFDANITLKRGRDAVPVVDEATGNTYLFLIDKKSVSALVIDKDFVLLDSLVGERPSAMEFPEIVGSNQSGGVVNLLFASDYYSHIAVMSFDFANKKVLQQLVDLNLKGERHAGSATYNGKFYMFTARKSSSILKLYAFHDGAKYTVDEFVFGGVTFDPYSKHLSGVLRKEDLAYIDTSVPISVEQSAKKNKIFCDGETIILTFDNQAASTEVITIDLESRKANLAQYNHSLQCKNNGGSANSFVEGGHLYQFKTCSDEMELLITPLGTGKPVKTYSASRDGDIEFRNTDIVQEGGTYRSSDEERKLSKTKQFLRKVNNWNAGVSVYNTPSGKVVTLGAYQETTTPMAMPGMGFGAPIATPVGVVPGSFNPVGTSFGSYTSSKAVHFKSLLNAQALDHVQGEIKDNIFDRIRTFTKGDDDKEKSDDPNVHELEDQAKSMGGQILAETVFKYGDGCIYGYYHRKDRRYILVAFPFNQ